MTLPFRIYFDDKDGNIQYRVDGAAQSNSATTGLPYIGLITYSSDHFWDAVVPRIEAIIGGGYGAKIFEQYTAAQAQKDEYFEKLEKRVVRVLSERNQTSAEIARRLRVRAEVVSKCLASMHREGKASDIDPQHGSHTMTWRLT